MSSTLAKSAPGNTAAAAPNYRRDVVNDLVPYFRTDERMMLLVGDMGFGVIDQLRAEYPKRIINIGIMEQGAVGIAAGMALAGLKPVFYCMVNFLAFRAIEQIRNDVVLQNLEVKFIGTGANNYFKFLGHSHCCGQDDVRVFSIIKLPVYDPYTSELPFPELHRQWIEGEGPAYIRV